MNKKLINISELSKLLNLKDENNRPSNHILRFWEKEFSLIKPIILNGNRRFYDEKQVEIIKFIKYLIRDKGLTIKGAKKYSNNKKKVDVKVKNNIENEYFKENLKNKSKNILDKIKKIKNYG